MPKPSSHRSTLLVALAALALSSLAGCATTRAAGEPELRWPPPPDVARIRWVRSFASEYDLESGFMRKLGRVFVPPDPAAVVGNTTGMTFTPDESALIVASASTSTVLKVELAAGRITRVANADGRRPGSPFGVAVDAEGNLFVSDRGGEIWVYSKDDKFLRKFGEGHLDRPTGLALDRRRQLLYVVDGSQVKSENHRVEVFSLRGEHLRTVGTRGGGPGQFNFPTSAAVAPDGRLFVVDMLNFRVQVFDPDGQLLGMFGAIGAGHPGTFDKAKALAFDTFGNIYVVDSQQGYVQLFNQKFQPLMAFGGRADVPGFLSVPNAIAIDSKNNIFVGDHARRTVSQYELINTSADDSFTPSPLAPTTPAAAPAKPPGEGR